MRAACADFSPRALGGNFDLTLPDETAVGPELAQGRGYALYWQPTGAALIRSDLGTFWSSEMAWNEIGQRLAVGPVAATDPQLAVELSLQFNGMDLTQVAATFPSGARYVFRAAAHPY